MEEPNYVLYGNNAELAPKKNYEAVIITKRIIWGALVLSWFYRWCFGRICLVR